MKGQILSPADKKREVKKQLREAFKELQKEAFKDLDKAIAANKIPEYFLEEGTYYLSKCLIEKICIDRPYKPYSEDVLKDQYRVQLSIN